MRERMQRLEENQAKLYELLKAKDARLDALEAELRKAHKTTKPSAASSAATRAEAKPAPSVAPPVTAQTETPPVAAPQAPKPEGPVLAGGEANISPEMPPGTEEPAGIGIYRPGRGFRLLNTDLGEVNFGIYTYLRFLEQKGLDDNYVNGFGKTVHIDKREDVELNKVKLEFRGWLIDPHFQYVLYTWTNQTAQGQGAQVVVGGNLNWRFSEALVLGGGILSLPTTRSTTGNFPNWLTVDHRTLADEFFRGSYAQGFYAYGKQGDFAYYGMLANNLSTLGIDAAQMDGDFTTFSGAVWWMPTTGEFGPRSGFGDYEDHQNLATRLGAHFTFSPEDRQSQPNENDFDNSQIRLSNGTIIFTPGALAPDVTVKNVKYYMADLDWGLKYRGFALEGEYYLRWLNDFRTTGPVPQHQFFDHGFQVMASAMAVPKFVQLYTMGSYIFGEFGDGWESTAGVNVWIFKRRELRLNLECIYDHHSPTGGTSYPQAVGGTGLIFNANLEMSF
jgi:hypothetical protein